MSKENILIMISRTVQQLKQFFLSVLMKSFYKFIHKNIRKIINWIDKTIEILIYDENSVYAIVSDLLILIISDYESHLLALSELKSKLNLMMNSMLDHTRMNCSAWNFDEKINKNQLIRYTNLLVLFVLLKKQSDILIQVHQTDIIMKQANEWKLIVDTFDQIHSCFENAEQNLENCIHKIRNTKFLILLSVSNQLRKWLSNSKISKRKQQK